MERGYLIEQSMPPPGYHRRRAGLYVRDQPMAKFATPPSSGQAHIPKGWALTINGITVSPTAVYLASDINTGTGAWAEHFATAAGALALQAGSPTYDVDSLLGVGGGDDEGVTGDGTAWWQAAGNSFGDLGANDYAIFFVANMAPAGDRLINKRDGSNLGFELYANSATQLGYFLGDSGGIDFGAIGPGTSLGALMIGTLFHDRDAAGAENLQCIINNVVGTTDDYSAVSGDASSATPLRVGSAVTGLNPWEESVYLLALYKQSGWFSGTNSAAWLVAHREFLFRISGILPQLAPRGSYPLTTVRATTKYYYRSSQSTLHLAGPGLVVVDESGLQIEPAATNRCLRSDDYGNAYWTKAGSSSVASDAVASPVAGVLADTLTLDSGGIYVNPISGMTVDGPVKIGVWVKRDDVTGTLLIHNGRTGTTHGEWEVDVSALPDEWVYLTASSPYVSVVNPFLADASGYTSVWFKVASGSLDVHVWNTNAEDGGSEATSTIVNAGSYNTRNADNVVLASAIATRLSNAGQGTVECEILLPSATPWVGYLWEVSDGTASNRLVAYLNTDGKVYGFIQAGSGQMNSAVGSSVFDGTWHTVSLAWRTDRGSIKVDGVEAVDTSCTIPTGLNKFIIGDAVSGAFFLNGHIRNMRIWDYSRH